MALSWLMRAVALSLLVGCLSTVQASDVEPIELGRMAPKSQLGETLRQKTVLKAGATFNPNCVGPAMPACQRGSVDLELCACTCPWNYKGSTCGECDASSCKNGGTMNINTCKCNCLPGFRGDACDLGSKCLNGGTLEGGSSTNPSAGTCKCANAWSGEVCKDCALSCMHGAPENHAQCKCNCPANRAPPTCEQCRDPGCLNGGVFVNEEKPDGDEICGCQCPVKKAYKGVRCGLCVNPGCKNGATWRQDLCQCMCSNENWSGSDCNTCKINCINGKNLDPKTCTCVDGATVSYNPCKVGCRHGTLNPDTCTCTCKPGFKGLFCDQCEIEKCFNNGELQFDSDCKCKCAPPWTGDTCKNCPLNCGPHGTVKSGCGGCACASSKSGKWVGPKCDKCQHAPCQNGGKLDEATCTCKCAAGFGGNTCNACTLSGSDCENGSSLIASQCKCNCKTGTANLGDWTGQLCNKCSHQGCKNGGEVDPKTCRCVCVPVWRGRYCDACDHPFCHALASGRDETGKNGMVDNRLSTVPDDKALCTWAANSLGCPAGQN